MLKFALAVGIAFEWIFGAGVFTAQSLAYAALRTVCATLLAWMALECIRVLYMAAMSLDDRVSTPSRKAG
jgi:hypothetical protein